MKFELDRLTAVTYAGGATDSYTYDAAGNRTSKNGQPYTFNALSEMTAAPGGHVYTYDPQGRTATDSSPGGTTTYNYDSLDRITAKGESSGQSLSFKYDALSRLTDTTGSGLTRTYDYALSDSPLYERTQIGTPGLSAIARNKTFTFGPRGLLSTRVNGQAPTYPLIDEHGSILADATEAGTAINQRDYDPFGVQLTGPPAPDPTDPAAGLSDQSFDYLGAYGRAGVYGSDQIHMGARIYDPQSGRFVSRDPLPGTPTQSQSQNPYAYGLNGPGRYWDLGGLNANNAKLEPMPTPDSPSSETSVGVCDGLSAHLIYGYQRDWCYVHTPNGDAEITTGGKGWGLDFGLAAQGLYSNARCPSDLAGKFVTIGGGRGPAGIGITGNGTYAVGRAKDGYIVWVFEAGPGVGIGIPRLPFGGHLTTTQTDIVLGKSSRCACNNK